jgi:hypothetical protein
MTDHDNNHANAVAAQLRLAEENGTLPEDMDVDADEEEQTQYNCYVGEKGKHLWQCGYSTLVWSTPMLPRTQR